MKKFISKVTNALLVSAILAACLSPGTAAASLQGRTTVNGGWTTSHSPTITGTIPTWCNDVAVAIGPDDGDYVFAFSEYDSYLTLSNGNWSFNLAAAGESLPNGTYGVYVSSKCGYSSYADPLYDDYFYDKIYVFPVGCDAYCVTVHRFYNQTAGAHFYTSNETEKRQVMWYLPSFNYEGVSSFTKSTQTAGTSPVYRFYNLSRGVHFYTINEQEKQNLINTASSSFRFEGVAYYAYSYNAAYTVPFYRFYNKKVGVHFYTSSEAEKQNVINTLSDTYNFEGIGYYLIGNN